MKAERWAQVRQTLDAALELPEAERKDFLERVGVEDDSLRREVESLLHAMDGDDSLEGARDAVRASVIAAALDRDGSQTAALQRALGAQYDILRPLGRGGMGVVYLARERSLDRFVAVKVLRPELAATASARERFRREARIAAQLSHPSIVPLHAFGEAGGVCYFVMGYARGETLQERLRIMQMPLPWQEVHQLTMELADALAIAHEHGIIHRDIKPANILLDEKTGHAMLADFGISKVLSAEDSLTATGDAIGTPGYMSPEQVQGAADIDERSDVYSLGLVAYVMLAGEGPFDGVSTREYVMNRLTRDPKPLRRVVRDVPEELADVVMKCLARDRAARWRDMRELKEALVRAGATASAPLPEPVRDLPSFGAYAILWAAAWGAFAMMSGHEPSERVLLLLIAFLVPLGLALHVWNVGRHGLRPAQLARVAAWPPEWWGMWWPRSLRRPTDLWPRLPLPARLVRVALSMVFLVVPGLIALRQFLQSRRVGDGRVDWQWFLIAEGAVVAAVATIVAVALAWTQRNALTVGEAVRLLFGATADSSSWSAPSLARLLAPLPGGVQPPDRDVASDHRRAIDALAAAFPDEGADVAKAGAAAAHRAVAAIEQCDRERAAFTRDADSGALDRLSAQLASYGDPVAGESAEHGELRELVRSQLDVVRRLGARREEVARRRSHLMELLRGLWTRLLALRGALVSDRTQAAMRSAQVRAICEEIDAAISASSPAAR